MSCCRSNSISSLAIDCSVGGILVLFTTGLMELWQSAFGKLDWVKDELQLV